jgi:hypothetical protein
MTREADNTVKLSLRDWLAIGALALTIMGSVLGAFLHHDRLLMQLVTQQQAANSRLDKIESKLERRLP